MPVVNTEIVNFTLHRGGNRAVAEYTFASGHTERKRISNAGIDEAAALVKATNIVSGAEDSVANLDAEKAEYNNLPIEDPAGESTLQQRARQYLKRAMAEDNPIIAFSKLDRFNTFRTNQGWTVAQVKAQLNLTDPQWAAISARYGYLDVNKLTLINYQAVVDGDTIRGD